MLRSKRTFARCTQGFATWFFFLPKWIWAPCCHYTPEPLDGGNWQLQMGGCLLPRRALVQRQGSDEHWGIKCNDLAGNMTPVATTPVPGLGIHDLREGREGKAGRSM